MSKTPEQFRGRAIGSLLAFVFLGQFFSSVVSQPFIEQLGSAMLFGIGGVVLLIVSLMFVGNLIRIRLTWGSKKISSNKYTILCKDCGALNFYEVETIG